MTTVVFKDGIIATDSMISSGGEILGTTKKIIHAENGNIILGAGSTNAIETFIKFYNLQEYNKDILKSESNRIDIIVINPLTKEIIMYDDELIAHVYEADAYALGSGRAYALGALAAGVSPEEAILIAAKYDKSTDTNVQLLKIW